MFETVLELKDFIVKWVNLLFEIHSPITHVMGLHTAIVSSKTYSTLIYIALILLFSFIHLLRKHLFVKDYLVVWEFTIREIIGWLIEGWTLHFDALVLAWILEQAILSHNDVFFICDMVVLSSWSTLSCLRFSLVLLRFHLLLTWLNRLILYLESFLALVLHSLMVGILFQNFLMVIFNWWFTIIVRAELTLLPRLNLNRTCQVRVDFLNIVLILILF